MAFSEFYLKVIEILHEHFFGPGKILAFAHDVEGTEIVLTGGSAAFVLNFVEGFKLKSYNFFGELLHRKATEFRLHGKLFRMVIEIIVGVAYESFFIHKLRKELTDAVNAC